MQRKGSSPEECRDLRPIQGLLSGVLLAVPLWVCIGVAIAVSVQDGPISEKQAAILFVAAAAELILLRQTWHVGLRRLRPIEPQPGATVLAAHLSRLRPLLLALFLTGTYLHYMFWDVQLQIAAMPSITVFVHPRALG